MVEVDDVGVGAVDVVDGVDVDDAAETDTAAIVAAG